MLIDFEISFKLRNTALKSVLFVLTALSRCIGSLAVAQNTFLGSLIFLFISLGSLARSDDLLERLNRLAPWLSCPFRCRFWRFCVASEVARGRSVNLVLEGDLPRSLGCGRHVC